jgi:hypothetical protein
LKHALSRLKAKYKFLPLGTAAFLGASVRVQANAGLRTPMGDVVVKHIQIGRTYSLNSLLNLPLRLVNTGDSEVDLRIEVLKRGVADLKPGYDAIGSADWVRVAQSSFTVAPSREVATDLILSIPNDTSLLGRRFEADIWSHTSGGSGQYAVGIVSRLLLQIDSTPPTEEELKKKFVDENLASMDFTILPTSALTDDFPLGRVVDLRRDRKIAIKLVNPNERALNFRVRSIPVWESVITPSEGFEDAYNPQWLTPEKDVVKVDGNSIGDVSFKLNIPDEERNRGKSFMFLVTFDLMEQKISTHVYYRLFVKTAASVKSAAAAKP